MFLKDFSANYRPVYVALGVYSDSFRSAVFDGGGFHVFNESPDRSIFGAADADAFLNARLIGAERFRIRNIHGVVFPDIDSTGPPPLHPCVEVSPVLVEDLDSIVGPVAHKEPAARIDRDRVRREELARTIALFAPGLDKLAVLRKLGDPVIALQMPFGDEDIAIGRDRDIGGLIEKARRIASNPCFTQRHQDLAIRAELED